MSTGQLTNSILESFLADVPNANQDTTNGKNVAVKKERREVFPPPSFSSLSPAASLALFGSSSLANSSPFNASTQHRSSASSSASSSHHPHTSSSSLFNNSSESRPHASPSTSSQASRSNQVDVKPSLNNEAKKEPEVQPIDTYSIKGVFGWEVVADTPLPVIMRQQSSGEKQKLVAVRIVENKIIGKFSTSLPYAVFSCINIKSYYVTEAEAKLLNEINQIHCDHHFGYEAFTTQDVVVELSDVQILHTFLSTSKEIFTKGLPHSGVDWLGFVTISGSLIVPYIAKSTEVKPSTDSPTKREGSGTERVRKYVPDCCIADRVLIVKVNKIQMTEWDASYFRMLCIYAGLDQYNFQSSKDSLCRLYDLKWDRDLCPLHIEECSPPMNKSAMPASALNSGSSQHARPSPSRSLSAHQQASFSRSSAAVGVAPGTNQTLQSLHQVEYVDLSGYKMRSVNLKPYSTQQAVFVSDLVNKMFRGQSVLAVHYCLKEILQVKLYDCTRLHEDAFIRSGVRPHPGDKLVLVDVLRKCLPQLKQILSGVNGGMAAVGNHGIGANSYHSMSGFSGAQGR